MEALGQAGALDGPAQASLRSNHIGGLMDWRENRRKFYSERHLLSLNVSQHSLAVLRPWLRQ
ncbi:hypothetical protein DFAR_1310020 [Desulfarculales bacterium]